jgi:hypothetical protein
MKRKKMDYLLHAMREKRKPETTKAVSSYEYGKKELYYYFIAFI